MDEVKSTNDIDLALEATAGVIIDIDTVAIFDPKEELFGVYVKSDEVGSVDTTVWRLKFTTLSLKSIGG